MDLNELIASAYLEYVVGCDMVETHIYIGERSDSIDVIGVNTADWTVYVCEVEDHLLGSKFSLSKQQKNHVTRCVRKFREIAYYVNQRYEGFEKRYMLWTPVVTEHDREFVRNPVQDLNEIVTLINIEQGITVEPIANERYAHCLKELRQTLGNTKRVLSSPVLRFIQLEEQLSRHIAGQPIATIASLPETPPAASDKPSKVVAIGKETE